MPYRHVLVAILVVALWGLNFVFIKFALKDLPPFTLAAARFFLTAFPALLFIPRPKVKWSSLAAYGLTNFALQFGFLFTAMRLGMSAGLSSMILQVQVFFTIGLAAFVFKEKPNATKMMGALISFSGVVLVGFHSDKDVNILGLLMLLGGSLSWASGNIISKSLGSVNPLALVVWGGLIAFPCLALVAWGVEGHEAIVNGFRHVSASALLSLAYIVYISTHLCYSLWSWLIREYSASSVAPFTLLVPIFGFLSSALILNEELADWKIHAAILVVSGLLVNIYGSRKRTQKTFQ